MFQLHPQLAADCAVLGDFPLCRLLMLRDANYPWFVLVPMRAGIREIHHLDVADQRQLLCESAALAGAMETAFEPDKLNLAALGNMVPQLHLHHVARYRDDPAWPAPVWGRVPARAYGPGELEAEAERLLALLPAEPVFKPSA